VNHTGLSGPSLADAVLPDSPNVAFHMDHAGPSALSDDEDTYMEDIYMDHPAPSAHDDDASVGGDFDEVYGLSNLRRSRRIAGNVEKIGQQRWGSNGQVGFLNDGEESDEEEEEDIEDDGNYDIVSDEGYEDDDELFAGPGQEGISLWDSLGEGFLREVSQLGMS
jgi:hypothetical protein